MYKLPLGLAFAFRFLFFAVIAAGQRPAVQFATQAELLDDLKLAPCSKNSERRDAVVALFTKAGATESEIEIRKDDDLENVVITKKGSTAEKVIIGAHYDKTSDGCGVLDNWSGVSIIANIYRTMRLHDTQKTYVFVAFDEEEKGLLGSSSFADDIEKSDRTNYCAMVNFDSFGMGVPQALGNVSTEPLIKLAEAVSGELKLPFARAGISFASSDSASFNRRDIPAITLHGLGEKWSDYLHNSKDKIENVDIASVHAGYLHGLILISKIERSPCNAFRK